MADTLLPPFTKSASADVPAIGGIRDQIPIEDSPARERVRRLRQRFLYCLNHPKWVRFREQADEDFKFYNGTGQWDEELRRSLEAQGRPALTINRVRPIVQTVIGYERGARMDLRPVPTTVGTSPPDEAMIRNVMIFGRLMKKVNQDQKGEFVLSRGFKDGVIGGMGAWYFGVDYLDDPVHGRVHMVRVKYKDFLYDPDCSCYDLEDAREIFWHKLVPVEVLKAQYADAADDIDDALSALPTDTPGSTHALPSRDPFDGYRTQSQDAALTLWDDERREVRVVEAWFQTWETVKLLLDKRQNRVETIPDDPVARQLARDLAAADPEQIRLVDQRRRRWEMSVFLPATMQEIATSVDGEHPFPNDTENPPFVQFLAYEDDDEIMGLTRNLKDPQREVNKRRSAMIDNASKHGMMKWFARRGNLENPEFLEGGIGAGMVGWTKGNPNQERPIEAAPPPMPDWVVSMEDRAVRDLPDVSGINLPLQGKANASDSGRKVALLQQQGQIQTSEIFDNYRHSRQLCGLRLGKRIQQVFTGPMVVRLETEAGDSEFVTLNEQVVDDQGHVTVERDIPSLLWDVEITDSPATPTARAAMLAGLMEYIREFPEYKDALADLIAEVSDFPARKELVARIRQVQQARGALPQPGAQPGASPPALALPPGAVPGAPPAGAMPMRAMPMRRPRPMARVGPSPGDLLARGVVGAGPEG